MDRWYRSIPGIAWVAGWPRRRTASEVPALPERAPSLRAAASAPPAQAAMAVVCAWCGARMAFRPIAPAQRGLVSHGLCIDCAKRLASASFRRE